MPHSKGELPKLLRDTKIPSTPLSAGGKMEEGLKHAAQHLSSHVRGEAPMHKCRKG